CPAAPVTPPTPSALAAASRIAGSSPTMTRGEGAHSKYLSPPSVSPPYSPHDPASTDASATNVWAGSVRVPHGSPWGRPKADRWPDVDTRWGNPPTSHRGNPEGQRSGQHHFNNPQPETAAISPKSRAHGAMDASYIQISVRSVHRPLPSISANSEPPAVGPSSIPYPCVNPTA